MDDKNEIVIPAGAEHDTITIDDNLSLDLSDLTINMSSLSAPSYTYSNPTFTAGSGVYTINTSPGTNGTWGAIGSIGSIGATGSSGFYCSTNAEFEGDVKIKGRSIAKTLEKIEDRLAILQEPDPKKLEKFAALKKAYDNYKMLERLIGDDDGSESR